MAKTQTSNVSPTIPARGNATSQSLAFGGAIEVSEEKLKAERHEVEYRRERPKWRRSGGKVVATGGNGGEAVTIHNV